jgi:ribosomal-protein-alanine N-acetyltransferase
MPEPPPSLLLRTCTERDLDAVLKIEAESFPDPYDLETFSQLLRYEPDGFLVAEGKDGILGYAASSARYGLIFSLAVSADHRRSGIGRKLMNGVLDYLRGRADSVLLQVRVSNTAAIQLYRKFGFREEGRVQRYYPDGEDALAMSLDFGAA